MSNVCTRASAPHIAPHMPDDDQGSPDDDDDDENDENDDDDIYIMMQCLSVCHEK